VAFVGIVLVARRVSFQNDQHDPFCRGLSKETIALFDVSLLEKIFFCKHGIVEEEADLLPRVAVVIAYQLHIL
jgi:hypothetical protein